MYKNLAAALLAACACLSAVLAQTPAQNAAPSPAKPSKTTLSIKAGFVYVSPITEAGWMRQHDEGRKFFGRISTRPSLLNF